MRRGWGSWILVGKTYINRDLSYFNPMMSIRNDERQRGRAALEAIRFVGQ